VCDVAYGTCEEISRSLSACVECLWIVCEAVVRVETTRGQEA